jgi:coenzyme Q-binding protein COQ10
VLKSRYSASSLYPLIADVDSYSQFLPFCIESTVTKRDSANSPTRADLQVGWNGWSETFSSKVSCLKSTTVTVTFPCVFRTDYKAEASEHPLFQKLKATWTLTPTREKTTVSLGVEYSFSNPLYNGLAQQFAPKVAGKLVEAFETRAKEKLG